MAVLTTFAVAVNTGCSVDSHVNVVYKRMMWAAFSVGFRLGMVVTHTVLPVVLRLIRCVIPHRFNTLYPLQ